MPLTEDEQRFVLRSDWTSPTRLFCRPFKETSYRIAKKRKVFKRWTCNSKNKVKWCFGEYNQKHINSQSLLVYRGPSLGSGMSSLCECAWATRVWVDFCSASAPSVCHMVTRPHMKRSEPPPQNQAQMTEAQSLQPHGHCQRPRGTREACFPSCLLPNNLLCCVISGTHSAVVDVYPVLLWCVRLPTG